MIETVPVAQISRELHCIIFSAQVLADKSINLVLFSNNSCICATNSLSIISCLRTFASKVLPFVTRSFGRLNPNVAPCLCGFIIGIGITSELIILLFPFNDDDDDDDDDNDDDDEVLRLCKENGKFLTFLFKFSVRIDSDGKNACLYLAGCII
ncbi:hypothetical protein DERF_001375 [Dermatophagoides farinae]|uniref:Uncharacterized protein n=1 Tax=Dermatophagoides farinae TaxID=6954 RepID=A0A922IC47_DERFA|nr:hypothetical protein DERF_001375 [Dermatophagoides farinae]